MDDLISRLGVAAWLDNMGYPILAEAVMDKNRFPNERLNGKEQAMAELINKQKVLDLVRDICIDIMDECESYIDVIDGETDIVYKNLSEVNAILKCNKRIRNGIRQLPLENSNTLKWISVSERLPSLGTNCLITFSGLGKLTTTVEVANYSVDIKPDGRLEFIFCIQGHGRDIDVTDKVIAWMPLPKPWKGEEDG